MKKMTNVSRNKSFIENADGFCKEFPNENEDSLEICIELSGIYPYNEFSVWKEDIKKGRPPFPTRIIRTF